MRDKSSSGHSVLARRATKRNPAIQQSEDKFTARDIKINTMHKQVCALGALSVLLSAAQTARALFALLLTVALHSTTPFQDAPGQAVDFSRHEQVSQICTRQTTFLSVSTSLRDTYRTGASLRGACRVGASLTDAPGQTDDFSRRARQMSSES